MSTPATISEVLAGETVILDSSQYGEEKLSIVRVHRVTATQIIIQFEREGSVPYLVRFDRADGREKRASGYGYQRRQSLYLPTPELLARCEKQKLVARFTAMKWKDLHLDTLRTVNLAIKTPASQ